MCVCWCVCLCLSVCVCYLYFPFSNMSIPCAVLLPSLLQLLLPPIFPSSFSLGNIYLLIWILNLGKIKQWKNLYRFTTLLKYSLSECRFHSFDGVLRSCILKDQYQLDSQSICPGGCIWTYVSPCHLASFPTEFHANWLEGTLYSCVEGLGAIFSLHRKSDKTIK